MTANPSSHSTSGPLPSCANEPASFRPRWTYHRPMPAKSQRQRRWAYGVMGPTWAKAHHMNKVAKPKKKRAKK